MDLTELVRGGWGKDKLAWLIFPTYRQAKDIAWEPLKRMVREHTVGKPNETDLSLSLRCGGKLALRGAENWEALVGRGLDFAGFDEFADIHPKAWTEAIRPALADRGGRALFSGTPAGFDHFNELIESCGVDEDWKAFTFTTLQGGRVPESEIEAARRDMDPRTFRQEFEASVENLTAGRVYYAFERAGNLSDAALYEPGLPVCWALDFNVTPMTSVLCQIWDTTSQREALMGVRTAKVMVFDEIYLESSNTAEACEEFGNRMRQYTAVTSSVVAVQVYGDASGSQRSHTTAGSPSDWDTLRGWFARHREFAMQPCWRDANPIVKDRIAAVNGLLCNARGDRRLLVHPRCKMLIRDFEQTGWKEGSGILDPGPEKKLTHISDAMGYFCEREFGTRQAGGWRSNSIA